VLQRLINLKPRAHPTYKPHPFSQAGHATPSRHEEKPLPLRMTGQCPQRRRISKDPRRGHSCPSTLPLQTMTAHAASLQRPQELAEPRTEASWRKQPPPKNASLGLPCLHQYCHIPLTGRVRDTCSFPATQHKGKQERFPTKSESISPSNMCPGTQTLLCQ